MGVTRTQPFSFDTGSRSSRRSASAEPTPTKRRRDHSDLGVASSSSNEPRSKMARPQSPHSRPLGPTRPEPFSFVDRDLAKNREKAALKGQDLAAKSEESRNTFTKHLREYSSQECAVSEELKLLS